MKKTSARAHAKRRTHILKRARCRLSGMLEISERLGERRNMHFGRNALNQTQFTTL